MITKEAKKEKICLFCASDYHLEMLIIPYICKKIEKEKFYVITQDNLENSMKLVLNRINLKNELKEKIYNIGWNTKNIIYENMNKKINENKNNNKIISNYIINGDYNYILEKNKIIDENLKKSINSNIEIINCFHVGDKDVDIENLRKTYGKIINTIKL